MSTLKSRFGTRKLTPELDDERVGADDDNELVMMDSREVAAGGGLRLWNDASAGRGMCGGGLGSVVLVSER